MENFINLHADDGYAKYEEFISKSLAKGWDKTGASKIATKFFELVISELELNVELCEFGKNEKTLNLSAVEYVDFGQTIIKPDFIYNNKLVIEFLVIIGMRVKIYFLMKII